jgi:hypothetical protein
MAQPPRTKIQRPKGKERKERKGRERNEEI